MKPVDIDDIAFRLLELEQRFDSYTSLYEEELDEIAAGFNRLRQDILSLRRERESEQLVQGLSRRQAGFSDEETDDGSKPRAL